MTAPYISYVTRNPNVQIDTATFPGNLPFVAQLHLEFNDAVTFLVGENGSGKSTLLEAIAVLSGYPVSGGGTNDLGASHGLNEDSLLANSLWLAIARRPQDGYFFRADLQPHFASLLDERKADPDFLLSRGVPADPYVRYGGRPLHAKSHGEAFLELMQNRFSQGLFLLDEPESALSPKRQLTLLAMMHRLARQGRSQFIVATHSAILLTYPARGLCPLTILNCSRFPLPTHHITKLRSASCTVRTRTGTIYRVRMHPPVEAVGTGGGRVTYPSV